MSTPDQLFARVASVVVAAVVVAGLYVAGSPKNARLYRQDERRIETLQTARTMIQISYDGNDSLPAIGYLFTITNPDTTWFRDVETGRPYEYHVVTDSTFQLCAEFARPSREETRVWNAEWNHPAGRHCFNFKGPRRTVPLPVP